jgi:hypothetical protein
MISQKEPPARSIYITPQKQLEELTWPCAAPIVARIMLTSLFCRDLTDIIAHYAVTEPGLTNWYTALERLGALPRYVPRLPNYMFQTLMGKCHVFESEKRSNGSYYKVIDTHVLYLLPEQASSLRATVKRIEERARKQGIEQPDSYKIRTFWTPAEKAHGTIKRIVPMQWHLMTIWTIPGSHTVPHGHHAKMIADLKKRVYVAYQALSLHTAPLIIFLHKAATGKRLYQANNLNLTGRPSFSYVVERAGEGETQPLALGAFSEKGLMIERGPKDDDYNNTGVGIGVERIFP